MKIGIMLRHYGQHGGGVLGYTQNLLREMLALDSPHEFVLIYPSAEFIGDFGDKKNVKELVASNRSKLLWDQYAVPKIVKSEKLDILFNPKYSLPLVTKCKTVFVCHGLDWYVMPWGSKLIDRISHKFLIPRYANKADGIIAVSNITRDNVVDFLDIESSRIKVIYHGVDESFSAPIAANDLAQTRSLYNLPERFFLYVGQIYPPKNFGRLLKAYAKVGPKLGISLVIAGEHRWLCGDELELVDKLNLSSWVVRPGWIGRDILPSFYALAEAMLLPSLYESFGLPIVEAMSAGCPVVTSNRYGTKEIADDAAILVDPEDIESIADGMRMVVSDADLKNRLIDAGRKHASQFSWKKCAQETLSMLETTCKQ